MSRREQPKEGRGWDCDQAEGTAGFGESLEVGSGLGLWRNGQETCMARAEKVEGDVERSARRSGKVSGATGEVLAFFLRIMEIRGRGF